MKKFTTILADSNMFSITSKQKQIIKGNIKFEHDLPPVQPTSEFTLFLEVRGIFIKIDHMLSYKSHLHRIPCIKITQWNKARD